MVDSVTDELKLRLKQIIIEECDKDELTPADIADDAPLLGEELDLDSLDVLQICMAVKKEYGVRIEGNTAARRALKSINTLAQTIADDAR
ncbi:phosphopantetheine-binding protein [Gilvimarinus sp. SDUM040013]|uniref:Phosphopantetheine-binding protein n=1 Tax=Gilvimarinus gilvus TaxID=3058038 RepID=A0ABU4S1J1_9GAMM|nr:phosphopantetheine-binding protein [Gilvimarinus sp. SDUM040013]MDO3387803.1 phosphopantetheine-binding protein [Gilvimarinus sp. SDUM040013]MDX6851054.1 phosphopantetheine-binding protein [Gilvimarinus sp. SDUM040013]